MSRRFVGVLLLLLFTLPALAEEEQLAMHVNEIRVPQVLGVVRSPHGSPVAGVRVEIIRRENGRTVGEVKTDDKGRFAFPHLRNARYNIKVHHHGYADFYHIRVTTEHAAPELVLKLKPYVR